MGNGHAGNADGHRVMGNGHWDSQMERGREGPNSRSGHFSRRASKSGQTGLADSLWAPSSSSPLPSPPSPPFLLVQEFLMQCTNWAGFLL